MTGTVCGLELLKLLLILCIFTVVSWQREERITAWCSTIMQRSYLVCTKEALKDRGTQKSIINIKGKNKFYHRHYLIDSRMQNNFL